MARMTKREMEAFKYFMSQWKINWDLNEYYRNWYDEDLEVYRGYRNEYDYPMDYNMSFNKLLPRVFTVLARFMEQLYQAGTGDLISVRPRKRADVERAPRVQGLLNYQLENLNCIDEQGGSYLFNFQWLFNAVTFGKGIAKLYWKKEERVAPRRIDVPVPVFQGGQLVGIESRQVLVQEPQIVYNGPYAEVLHNKLFNPHPHYRSVQKMPVVGCMYKRSIDYLKQKEREGVFKNIKELGWSGGTHSNSNYSTDSAEAFSKSLQIEGASEADFNSLHERGRTPEVDVAEMYGRYIFPEDDSAYEVGSGYKIKGKESEAICHIGNWKVLLSLQKNPYGTRPFFDIGAYYHPELFWDIGIIRLGKDLQRNFDNLGNLRHQNVEMLINQMLMVREDADIDPQALIAKPFGLIPVEEMDDVQPLQVPDVFQSGAFQQMDNFFEETISDITGMYPYSMGQTPARQEHVGTIMSLQSMGEARTKLLMMTMDHTGFRPFLRYMMMLNTWHMDPQAEARINTNNGVRFEQLFSGDMHVDYDFSARYTALEPALSKMFRAQQLIQYAQMWQGSPYLQQYQFMKAILEMLDFHNSDVYLKNPQQVAQEMQMAAQQSMQTEMMGMQMQDQLMANQSMRELQRDVVKGLLK